MPFLEENIKNYIDLQEELDKFCNDQMPNFINLNIDNWTENLVKIINQVEGWKEEKIEHSKKTYYSKIIKIEDFLTPCSYALPINFYKQLISNMENIHNTADIIMNKANKVNKLLPKCNFKYMNYLNIEVKFFKENNGN